MGLPPDLNTIVVTGTYQSITGTPLAGQVNFSISVPQQDSTGKVILGIGTQSVALNSAGFFSVTLACTDNADLNPGNFTYLVTEVIPGLGRSYSVALPHSLGSTVDLSALAPVTPPPSPDAFGTANTWTGTQTFAGAPGLKITQGAGAGDVLTSDVSGNASWVAASTIGFQNPMTTFGDMIYENATPAGARIPGNTAAAKQFLTQTGTGSVSAAPAWGAIAAADVPGVAGVTVTGTPSAGQYPRASSASAAAWGAVQAGDLPAATTSAQGAVILDGTAADLRPDGVAAAGAKGQAADAEHVHPYQPWQFLPESYGAKGDGKVIVDATIGGGNLSRLTSATAGFTSADTGKHIVVSQAGGAAVNPLAATITFVNATTVTLSTPASGAVTSVGAIYGTDDTASVQSAIGAAVTYAQSSTGFAEVVLGARIYCIAGAPAKTATTQNNCQLYLPIITAANPKVTLAITGAGTPAVAHWLETGPPTGGSVLACMRTDGAYDATYGWPFVLGGPFNGYGGILGTFSNMCAVVDGLGILTPYYTSFGGMTLYGVGQADVRSFSCLAMAQVPATSVWPSYTPGGQVGPAFFTWGYVTPAVGNNALNNAGTIMVAGQSGGVAFSDHFTADKIIALYNIFAVNPNGLGSDKLHLSVIRSLCAEANTKVIYANPASSSAPTPVDITVAAEITAGGLIVDDSGNVLYGTVRFEDPSDPVGVNSGPSLVAGRTNGAANVKLIYLFNNPGHVPAANAPAVPASTVAQQNTFWRDAAVVVAGGTVSAVSVDGIAQGYTATGFTVIVPSGKNITLTYSVAPSWVWTLL